MRSICFTSISLSGEYCFRWGIRSISALPGDPTFNQFDNTYDAALSKKIYAEFGIDPSSEFRYTGAANLRLGSVYIYATGLGPDKTSYDYPGFNKFSDEGDKGNLIYYIEPDDNANAQADWFFPNKAEGLTQAVLSQINQSIDRVSSLSWWKAR